MPTWTCSQILQKLDHTQPQRQGQRQAFTTESCRSHTSPIPEKWLEGFNHHTWCSLVSATASTTSEVTSSGFLPKPLRSISPGLCSLGGVTSGLSTFTGLYFWDPARWLPRITKGNWPPWVDSHEYPDSTLKVQHTPNSAAGRQSWRKSSLRAVTRIRI